MSDDDLDFGAWEAGTAYALFRHGQDRQTRQVIEAILRSRRAEDDWTSHGPDPAPPPPPPEPPAIETNLSDSSLPDEWEDYIGQESFKARLRAHLDAARIRKGRLPDMLLTSPRAGLGKTTIVRMAARELGVRMIELVPPMSPYALIDAADRLGYRDILYIHEVQDFVNGVRGGGQALRHLMEQRKGYDSNGELQHISFCTVVAASSRPDQVPEAVADLFVVKGDFGRYDADQAAHLAVIFTWKHLAQEQIDRDVTIAIARLSGGLPSVIEGLVIAARDLSLAQGRNVTPEDLVRSVLFGSVRPRDEDE